MADPEPGRSEDEPRSLEAWLAHVARDTTLRPVLVVVAGSFSAIGAGILLSAWRGQNLAAIAALVLLALGSVDVLLRDLRRRRFGPVSRGVALLWLLSLAAAVAAAKLGLG